MPISALSKGVTKHTQQQHTIIEKLVDLRQSPDSLSIAV